MSFWSDYREFNKAMKALESMRTMPSMSELMMDQIEIAIAKTSVATCSEVREAYERLGSWDDVIIAAEKTCEGWRMGAVVDDILAARELADRLDKAGKIGADAGRTLRLALRIAEILTEEA